MSAIIYPQTAKAVIDVTKPPFNALPDGKQDCTAALIGAIDFVAGEYERALNETRAELEATPGDNDLLSFEIRKVEGKLNVVFPRKQPPGYIIYLPKGTYLVSDTVSYTSESLYNILFNIRWLELNAVLRIVGEDRDQTVIRLCDGCKGFEFGARKPVLSLMKGEKSGTAMSNLISNLTVDVGSNNPGAVGIRFFSNNSGQVKDVNIISRDGRGYAGIEIVDEKVSCSYLCNISVSGFDYGMRITPQQHEVTAEHITLKDQNIAGVYHMGSVLSLRDLKSFNRVNAVFSAGFTSHLILVDSTLLGGGEDYTAVNVEYGFGYLKNVRCEGYGLGFKSYFDQRIPCEELPFEISTHGEYTLWETQPDTTFFDTQNMPDPPIYPTDYRRFVSVADFGAVGDGITDDTDALLRAVSSGAEGVYFEPGQYLITRPIPLPGELKVLDFMFCDLLVGEELARAEGRGVFEIKEEGEPLLLCNLFGWESFHGLMTLVNNDSTRTLTMRMLHTQGAALYQGGRSGGRIFIESCACTVGGVPGAGARKAALQGENRYINARNIPCFYFNGQEVFARAINPERATAEIINKGGRLTVLGFKTEEEGTAFHTLSGGNTVVMGGICCIGTCSETPLIKSEDSHCHIVLSTMITNPRQLFPVAVSSVKQGEERILRDEELPKRAMLSYTVPKFTD